MTDIFDKKKRSEIMTKIRWRDTGIERRFQREHPEAIPHPDWLPYHPDFLLDGKVVFLDSGFWHGYVSVERYARLPEYWKEKLFRNIMRDCVRDSFWETVGKALVIVT